MKLTSRIVALAGILLLGACAAEAVLPEPNLTVRADGPSPPAQDSTGQRGGGPMGSGS
jgi:hypothetical protein